MSFLLRLSSEIDGFHENFQKRPFFWKFIKTLGNPPFKDLLLSPIKSPTGRHIIFQTMIIVSILALAANITCLYLLQKSKSKEAHMQASMIFTSNDVIINSGVILAGLLVYWFNSKLPDLIIGSIVFALVLQGASRILKLAK